jgi:excisionase family DNA binding protein
MRAPEHPLRLLRHHADVEDDWLSLQEAADACGMAYHTMRAMVRRGGLPAEKPDGKPYRIRRAEVEAFIARSWAAPGELTHLRAPGGLTRRPTGRWPHETSSGGVLPLGLGGEILAGPGGVGGVLVADVDDGVAVPAVEVDPGASR